MLKNLMPKPDRQSPYARGFTMLEMLVSLAIFSVVAVIAVGSLVRIAGLNRQARSLQDAMTNVSYVMESISREVRMGTSYDCKPVTGAINKNSVDFDDCAFQGGDNIFAFKSSKTLTTGAGAPCQAIVAYRFLSNQIQRAEQTDCNDPINNADLEGNNLIDTNNVTLSGYELYNYPSVEGITGRGYGFVRLELWGYAGLKEKERHYFHVATSISQRISD